MTQQNLLELAKQGNVQAIDVLLNRVFQSNGITAKTAIREGSLHLLLESEQVPNQQTLVPAIRGAMMSLGIESVQTMHLYGRQLDQREPAWSQTVSLAAPLNGEQSGKILPGTISSPPNSASASATTDSILPVPTFSSTTNGTTSVVGEPIPIHNEVAVNSEVAVTAPTLLATPNPVEAINPTPLKQRDNMVAARNGLLVGLALLTLGIVGLHKSVVSRQQQALDQAQILLVNTGTAKSASNLADLRAIQKQLQEAIVLLESVPDIPGAASRQAEVELVKVRAQLEDVQQRLDVEEQAQNNLATAQKLTTEAQNLLRQGSGSLPNTQQIQAKLRESLRLLSMIPAGTYASAAAQQQLIQSRTNYVNSTYQMRTEQQQLQQQRPINRTGGGAQRK